MDAFLAEIEADLSEGNIQRLPTYAPQAKLALLALRNIEGGESLADCLEPRLDFLIAAQGVEPQSPAAKPKAPPPPKVVVAPQYTQTYWDQTLAKRPRPTKANRDMPVFKKSSRRKRRAVRARAWLADVESSLTSKLAAPSAPTVPSSSCPPPQNVSASPSAPQNTALFPLGSPPKPACTSPRFSTTIALREFIDPTQLPGL